MPSDYWNQVLNRRTSRRRALAATGSSAAGAALLAACGGSSGGTKEAASGLVTPSRDETKSLKRGGVWKTRNPTDPPSFEVHSFVTSAATTSYCYGTLVRVNEGYLQPEAGEMVGDNVESWEFSPDKLTLTMKVHPGAHFASPVASVHGRAVDARDIVVSWQRVMAMSQRRGEYANEFNPDAPIVSLTATDDKTIVIKMKQPDATILSILAASAAGYMMIAPKEAQDQNVLDLRKVTAGSGPWYVSEYVAGSHYTFKRNPGYKQDKRDVPYIDQVDFPIIPEYAAVMAQFRTGGLYSFGVSTANAIRSEDILPLKREIPELEMTEAGFVAPVWREIFGVQDSSPFRDERVRQAWVLNWDRELFMDALYNTNTFRKEGLPIDVVAEGPMTVNSWTGWYLDPASKEYGANGKFFKHDPAEAKKLLQAAGHSGPVTTDLHLPAQGPDFGRFAEFNRIADVIVDMEEQGGHFKVNRRYWRYMLEFQPRYRDAKGKFDGTGMNLQGPAPTEPVNYLIFYYHPGGGFSQGTDPQMTDLLSKALREFDNNKRKELVHEVQRMEGQRQLFPRISAQTNYDINWPVLRNTNTWQSFTSGHAMPFVFIDPTRTPLKRA